jgi:hypothetical protein
VPRDAHANNLWKTFSLGYFRGRGSERRDYDRRR